MWMHHRILHMTFGCEFLGTSFKIASLLMINVVRLDQNILSWTALRHILLLELLFD